MTLELKPALLQQILKLADQIVTCVITREENRGVEGALDDWFSWSASLSGIAAFYQFMEQIDVESRWKNILRLHHR